MATVTGAGAAAGTATAHGWGTIPRSDDNRAAALLRRHGQRMLLKRSTEGQAVAVYGVARRVTDDDLGGTSSEQTFRVRLAPQEIESSTWATPWPTRGDALEMKNRSYRVLGGKPIKQGDAALLYLLTVAG